jgi:PKD repeat protein
MELSRVKARCRRLCQATTAALLLALGLHATLRAGSVSSIAPLGASPNVTINITGTGFNATASLNTVTFRHLATGATFTASGTAVQTLDATRGIRRLGVRVPAGAPIGPTAVTIINTATGEQTDAGSIEVIRLFLPEISAAPAGSTVAVRVTGSPNVLFAAGTNTRVGFGAGITVQSTTVESPTSLVATLVISASAAAGPRALTMQTINQNAIEPAAFTVGAAGTPVNRAPTASAGGPYSGVAGSPIALVGSGSDPDGDPLSFSWAFGDGTTGSGASVAHAYAEPGSYVAVLTVSDGRGGSAVAEAAVTVTSPPPPPPANRVPTASAGGPYTGTAGQPLALSGSGSDPDGDPLTYEWTFGDGATGSGPAPAHTYATAGQYTVTLTVRDGRGGEASATTTAAIVRPNGTPTARASGPPTGETGEALTFRGADSSDPDGDLLTYAWDFGDGSPISTETNPSHAFSQAGSYAVSLTVTDPFNAADSASVSVTIALANRPPTAVPGGPYTGQTGSVLTLDGAGSSDPDGDPITYSWDFGDGTALSTLAQPTHTYATTGQFIVTLTVQDGRDGQATATTSAAISHTNGTPTARASGPPTGDAAATLAFRGADSTDPDGDPLTYSWDFGDGSARSTQANPLHAFAQAGPYLVSLTVTDSFGAADTATLAVTITNPNRRPTAVPGGPYTGQTGAAVAFDGTASSDPDGEPLTYSWDFGDGSTTSSASTPSHVFAAGGTYVVSLTVTDPHGASDTATVAAAVTGANRPPTANAGGPYSGEAGVVIPIDGSGSSDPDGTSLAYSWDFGDGTPAGDGVKPPHAYTTTGTFTVTLTVTDPGGLSSTASTTATVTASIDRIPPVVTLTGAKQALPGSQVLMTAEATDNVAVSSVALDVNGADPVSFVVGPYQRLVSVPEIAAPGSEIRVHAVAKDPSDNEGSADATITIVAQPDTAKPTITLNVPPHATAGASILVTADAGDNVAVTGVDFSANTTPIGSDSTEPYQVPSVVPADAPIGAVFTYMALASDAAGNQAQATATLTVVGTPDNAPPTVTLTAPPTATAGTTIKLVANAADDSGVASVAFALDGADLGTRVTLPYEVSYTIPPTAIAGTRLHAEARARDGAALEAVASADIMVTAPGQGVLTGAVFDDSIGLPVAGASVALVGEDARGIPYSQTTVSDSRGQYVLAAVEGQATISITKAGWTALDRHVTIQRDAALHVIDARLTTVGLVSPIGAAAGGAISGAGLPFLSVWQRDLITLNDPYVTTLAASGPTVMLEVAPGSLAADASLSLTPVSRQGLAGLLPVGWTPIAAIDIAPHGVLFALPASLKVPLPLRLPADTPLTIARWDDSARVWRAAAQTTVAQSATTLAASIESTGQFAWLLADVVPLAPPSPIVGDPVPGVDAALVPATAAAIVDPQPRIIFYKPGVKSDVRGRVTTTTPLSSGAIARTRILESYDFFSGAHMQLDPTLEDVVLFQVPGTGGTTLVAGYPVAPSLTFEALALQQGVITVELRAPGGLQESIEMIGAGGGSVATVSGERIEIGSGAITGPLPVSIASLTTAEIGVAAPEGFEIVGAVLLDFANVLAAPGSLSVPRGVQVQDGDLIVVARMQELIGQTRFVTVGLGSVSANRVTSVTTLPGTTATFEGIRAPGRYVFLRATAPAAFASGVVADTDAAPFPGAVVSMAPASALVSVSQPSGRYIATIPVGGATLMARNPIMGDSASRAANAAAAREIVALDFSLVAHFPAVAAVNPRNGAEGVALSGPIVITFTMPIDPATATAEAISVTSPAGPVAARRELSNGNTVVTFRSTDPLEPNTVYTLRLTTAIADRFGRAMQAPVTTTFSSLNTIAPPPPPAGSISASIPINGRSTVTVTQGAAGSRDTVIIRNITRGTTTPMSVVDPSVGFTVQVDASITDQLQLVIRDRSGNETVVALPAFRSVNADGSVSQAVTNAGGHIEGPAGIAVDVQSGTFPDGAVVTVTPVAEASFPLQLSDEQRQFFSYSGGVKLDYGGKKPQIYLNVSIPAAPADNEADRWIVVRALPFQGETLLDIADTARVIDGRIATSSPPCPGVSAAAVYGFLRSSRQLSVLTGSPGVMLNPEAANTSYLLAARMHDPAFGDGGFAMPGAIVAGMEAALGDVLLSAPTFCVPVLSGRLGAVPNQVSISVNPAALVATDLQLIVTNNAPVNTVPPRNFFRPFPEPLSMSGGVNDPIVVQAKAADGTIRPVDSSLVTMTGRPFVVVEIGNVIGDYRALIVENLRTHKQITEALLPRVVNGSVAGVNLPLVRVLADGLPSDPFDVQAVTNAGVKVPFPATVQPYDAGGGNMIFSALRGTIDPTPDEIDAYNATLPPGADHVNRLGGTTRAVLEIWTRDPTTNALTHTSDRVLLDVATGVNHTVDGGFRLAFDENSTSVFYLSVHHLNGAVDRAKFPEFRVTVTNHTTKATVRELLGPAPPPNDTTVINVYGAGSATPELETSLTTFTEMDPSAPLTLSFSAPIERNSALSHVELVDASGATIAGTIVFGKDPLNGVDSIVTFIPNDPLPLAQSFTLRLIGVLDLMGRPLSVSTIAVTTFTPTVQATYSELNIDGSTLPFNDIRVLHDNGPSGPRTTLLVTSGNSFAYKLHSVDVTAPGNPFEPPNAHAGGGHLTRRLALQTDTLFPISGVPQGCDTHVNNSNFFGHFAMGSASNTDDSSLMFYDVTNPAKPCTLGTKKITTNPAISGAFQRGTFRTLNYGAGGAAFLKTTTGYAAYMAIREVGLAAVDVGRNIPGVPIEERQTEGLAPGDYTDVVAVAGDRLLALNNNYGSGATLDVLDPNLSPIASVAVDNGTAGGGGTLAHQIAYATNVLVDKNNDGQYEDSEVFSFAYVGGRAGVTIVDVTDPDNPAPVTTFPVGTLVRQVAASRDGRRLYVGGAVAPTGGAAGGDAFYIVDVANPFASLTNRVIYKKNYPQLNRIQVDGERPYVYLAYPGAIDIVATEAPNLTGTIQYTRYPVDFDPVSDPNGTVVFVNYERASKKPVRGAVVELRDAANKVVARSKTDSRGFYALNAPPNATLTVSVKAELGSATNPRVRVVDGLVNGPCPATEPDCLTLDVEFPVRTGNVRVTKDFVATSEWNGGSYTSRNAAALAILDTAYEAEQFVSAAFPTLTLPPLTIDWSPNRPVDPQNPSHFEPAGNRIVLQGQEDIDTDEFDTTVILHEWAHYLMRAIGRVDQLGESHKPDDRLDPPAAWDEGFADAFAGMVLAANPAFTDTRRCSGNTCQPDGHLYYVDTAGPLQGSLKGALVPLDANDGVGADSEMAVASVIYNFAANGHFPGTATAINLMAQSPAFMTVYSYLKFVKDVEPARATAFTAAAASVGIGNGDEWGASDNPLHTTITGSVRGETSEAYGPILYPTKCTVPGQPANLATDLAHCLSLPDGDPLVFEAAGNKLDNWQFFKFNLPADGACYRLYVEPHGDPGTPVTGVSGTVLLRQIGGDVKYGPVDSGWSMFSLGDGQDHSIAVGSLRRSPTASSGATQFSIAVMRESSPAQCTGTP